jgi:hypothetical protein
MGPGIFSTKCHTVPKLPRDLDLFTRWRGYNITQKTKTSRAGAKVVIVKGDEQGEVGVRQRSHAVFWSCCKSQQCQYFFDVDEVANQNNEGN